MKIPKPAVNFDKFVLDFMQPDPPENQDQNGEDEEKEYSRDDALDQMESAIPENAVRIGTFATEVEN